MDGAAWNVSEGTIIESAPKKLFYSMPVIFITAVSKNAKKNASPSSLSSSMNTFVVSVDYGPFGGYDCPIYKYPIRTDRYKIFSIVLPTKDAKPLHWILRGVALLCVTA